MIQENREAMEPRPVTVELPLTTVESGKEFSFLVALAEISGIQPGDVVSLEHLLVPKTISKNFSLVKVNIDRSYVNLASNEAHRVSSELPTVDCFFLDITPMPAIFKVMVTVKNNSETDQPFNAQLVCQIRSPFFMWGGDGSTYTRRQKLGYLLSQAGFLAVGGLHSLARHISSKREREQLDKENDDVFEPVCDCDGPIPRVRLRDHLRLMAIDMVGVASFPLKAALHLTTKSLEDLAEWRSPPRLSGQTILDCGSTKVEAGQLVNVNVQCQVPFRPLMLKIPAHLRTSFVITDIKVGKNSQFVSPRPLPATAFAWEDGTPIALKMDVARPGMWITISVLSTRDVSVNFEATLIGTWEELPR